MTENGRKIAGMKYDKNDNKVKIIKSNQNWNSPVKTA